MADANKPDTAQPMTPEQKEALATQIVVDGVTFQLKGMTVEQAAELYKKLPADYQQLADKFTVFAKNYRAAIDIKLPPGMKFEDAWKEYLDAARDEAGKLIDKSKPHLLEMASLFDPLLPKPGLTAKALGKGFSTVRDLLAGAIDGADVGLALPFQLLSATGLGLQDGWRALATGITEEKAKAFGAAMAGSAYYEARTRQGKSASELSLSNPGSAMSAGLTYLTKDMPLASDFWTEIKAFAIYLWEAITHIGKDESGRSLTEIQNEQRTKHAADTGKTYGERLHANLAEKEFPKAAERVRLAKTIAGESVEGRVAATLGESAYVAADGKAKTANRKGEETPLTDNGKPDGKPVTRPQVVVDRFAQIADPIVKTWDEHGVFGKAAMVGTAGATAVGAGALAVVGAKGVAKGAAEGYRDAPLNRAHAHAEQAEKLAEKAAAPQGRFESDKRYNARTARAADYTYRSANAGYAELETHVARGGNASAIDQALPSTWERFKHHVKHPAEFMGKLLGRTADELATTAGAAKDVLLKSGERLGAVGKLIPRGPMALNIVGSAIEDGGALVGHAIDLDGKGVAVDMSKMAGTVGGSVAGTVTGANIGGWIGQGIGHLVGFAFGGIGTIPGGAAGRVGGMAIGGFFGGWSGGTLTRDATGATVAAVVDYKPKPEATPEVKPFTQEEIRAMIDGHSEEIKAAQLACKAADPRSPIKFSDGKRIGFAFCSNVTLGALSSGTSGGNVGGQRAGAQPVPAN